MDEVLEVALALVEGERGWLVARRAAGRVFAGLWEFPGGKIETGETAEAAAVREVGEELGVVVKAAEGLGEVQTAHAGMKVKLHLICCRVTSGEARACDAAVEEVRWVSLAEMAALPMPPVNAQIIARLAARTRRES